MNPGFRALQAIAEASWKSAVRGGGGGSILSYTWVSLPEPPGLELSPIIGESARASHTPLAKCRVG